MLPSSSTPTAPLPRRSFSPEPHLPLRRVAPTPLASQQHGRSGRPSVFATAPHAVTTIVAAPRADKENCTAHRALAGGAMTAIGKDAAGRERAPRSASASAAASGRRALTSLGSGYPAARHFEVGRPGPPKPAVGGDVGSSSASRSPLVSLSPPSAAPTPTVSRSLARSTAAEGHLAVVSAGVAALVQEEADSRRDVEAAEGDAKAELRAASVSFVVAHRCRCINDAASRLMLVAASAVLLDSVTAIFVALFDAMVTKTTAVVAQFRVAELQFAAAMEHLRKTADAESAARTAVESDEAAAWREIVDAKMRTLSAFWSAMGPSVAMRLLPAAGALRLQVHRDFTSASRGRSASPEPHQPASTEIARLQQCLRDSQTQHAAETRRILTQLVRREAELAEARRRLQVQQAALDAASRKAELPPLASAPSTEHAALVAMLVDAQTDARRFAEERDELQARVDTLLIGQAKSAKTIQLLEGSLAASASRPR